jgi:hypothetical protein
MAGLSDAYEIKVLDVIFGKATLTSPTIYVGLATAAISDTDTGSTIAANSVEVSSGGGYARATTSAVSWNSAASGSTSNISAIAFASSTAPWGTITHVFLADASDSTANVIAFGSIATALAVTSDTIVQFAVGAISCVLS